MEKPRKLHPKKRTVRASLCMYEKWNSEKPTAARTQKQYEISLFSHILTAFSPRFRPKKPKRSMILGKAETQLPGDFFDT